MAKPKPQPSIIYVKDSMRQVINLDRGYLCQMDTATGECAIKPFADLKHLTVPMLIRAFEVWGYERENVASTTPR